MTSGNEEKRIRDALAEAHRRDAERMPAFERTWAAARRSGGVRPWTGRWVLSAGLAAATAVGVWYVLRPSPPRAPLPLGTRWVAPTDFLLETPDLVTLRTLPALDPAGDRLLSPTTDARGN